MRPAPCFEKAIRTCNVLSRICTATQDYQMTIMSRSRAKIAFQSGIVTVLLFSAMFSVSTRSRVLGTGTERSERTSQPIPRISPYADVNENRVVSVREVAEAQGIESIEKDRHRLSDLLDRVSKLRNSDVDWEWTQLGKVRPVLPMDVKLLWESYDDAAVATVLLKSLEAEETFVVGHVLLSYLSNQLCCCATRRSDGFDVLCNGLSVRVHRQGRLCWCEVS